MKRFYFPIFWKFSLAIILIVITFASFNAYLIWNNVYTNLQRESEKRGLYIAQNIAEQAVTPLLYEDYIQLQSLLENAIKLDSSVSYIFLVNEQYDVIVHTFDTGFPDDLLQLSKSLSKQGVQVSLIRPVSGELEIIRDISVPIFNGKLGLVHVGISEKQILADVNHTIQDFWFIVFLFLVIGIGGAFAFSFFITKPVKRIQKVTEKLDLEALESGNIKKIEIRNRLFGLIKPLFRAEDEIDILTNRFNYMIDRLQTAYQDLQKANKKLIQSEKMASIGTISAGIAHEINNPIAGIKNCLRRIQKNPEDSQQNTKYVKMMDEAINRIEIVVRQLLDFSRKHEIVFKPINLRELIENAIVLVLYRLERQQISFTNDIPKHLPAIKGSENHLLQVFVNLILNSIDAIEEKFNALEGNHGKFIQFSAIEVGKYVVFQIKDNGIGIDKEKRKQIFDPFFTTKSIGKGTGLGLAVSYNIIQIHGGKMEVESTPGEGTVFKVYLRKYENQ
ncbi:MAG: ATP-binding protein [Calditrichia bacterium]